MYELTFPATEDGRKLAKLCLALDRVFAIFKRQQWAMPANRAEFHYADDSVEMWSSYEGNIRTTAQHNRTHDSYSFIVDAVSLAGRRVAVIGEIGGEDDVKIIHEDHYYFVTLNETVCRTLDHEGSHKFSMSSPAFVTEYLQHELTPWANHPVDPKHKLRPVTPEIVRALVRLGYRSTGATTWAAPGANIGQIQ